MSNKPAIPIMPGYTPVNTLAPFRQFCQKVLPAVYDDSLSYYELLCKVVNYLNETMSNVNELNKNFTELYNFVAELHKWIADYFTNLDVQEEINNKLDQMVEDGTLEDMVLKAIGQPIFLANLEKAKESPLTEITVQENNSKYSLDNIVHYATSPTQGNPIESLEVKQSSGSFIAPTRVSTNNVPSSYDYGAYKCALSWLNRGIIYGNNGTIFDPVVNTDEPQMVCSDFLVALLRDVNYESSALVLGNGNNAYGQHACDWQDELNSNIDPNTLSFTSYELAYWLASQNRLYYKPDTFMGIKPGDLIFTGVYSGEPDPTGDGFLNIKHCQFVLAVYPAFGTATVVECGHTSNNFFYGITENTFTMPSKQSGIEATHVRLLPTSIRAIGRPAYPNLSYMLNKLEKTSVSPTGSVNSGTPSVNAYSFSGTFKARTPYILKVKGTIKNSVTNDRSITFRVVDGTNGNKVVGFVSAAPQSASLPYSTLCVPHEFEIPVFLQEDSSLLRFSLVYTGSSEGYDFVYDFTDTELYEVK